MMISTEPSTKLRAPLAEVARELSGRLGYLW
jgi:hypothetical protein